MNAEESVYKDFVGRYQVQKTLRFKLKPVGETEEWINKRFIIEDDEQRAEDAKRVKEIIDDMHREFIDDVLSNAEIDGWEELAEALLEKNNNLIKTLSETQRKKIVETFKKDDRFALMAKGNTNFIKDKLPAWMESCKYSDEDIRLVKSFKKNSGYFDKIVKARENMYSDKAQGTAIANRLVNENFTKFVANTAKIQSLVNSGYRMASNCYECINFAGYNKYLSQKGITYYNEQIGVFNSELNEDYQKNLIPQKTKLLSLHKQILSDVEPLFNIEKLENDGELVKEILEFFDNWTCESKCKSSTEDTRNPIEKTIEFLENISTFESCEIKINPKNLGVIAKCLPEGIGRAQIIETLNVSEDSKKDLLLADIVTTLDSSFDDANISLDSVVDNAKYMLMNYANNICSLYKKAREVLLSSKDSKSKTLLSNEHAISIIKELLDEVKYGAEPFRDLFGKRNDDTPSLFQESFNDCNIAYAQFDQLYNLVRNYLTQKPYSTEKFKLTFDYPTLCDGWDVNKESANRGILLFKGSKFYLGVWNSLQDYEWGPSEDTANSEEYYKKLVFKTAGGASKQMARIAFSAKWTNGKDVTRMKALKDKKSDRTKEEQSQLINYYQEFLKEYEWNEWFHFSFKKPSEYGTIKEFCDDVDKQAYLMRYKNVDSRFIDSVIEDGSLYLFELYNKDFSEYSTGKKNLHTYYWEQLFSPDNKRNGFVIELNGGAELFYRRASLDARVTHRKGDLIINKTYLNDEGYNISIPNDVYNELKQGKTVEEVRQIAVDNGIRESIIVKTGDRDIIKAKRYTKDQYNFHVPITINRTAPDSKAVSKAINSEVLGLIKENEIKHIIGVDRGERNLIYASVIDMEGNIVEQRNFNVVNGTDYHEKLDSKEKERKQERKDWKSISQIKDLKQGYLSQVIRYIADMVIEYDAILVMENLNYGFKTSVRAKFEKNVYQQFEKALLDKLSYLSAKPDNDDELWQAGGIAQGYQLVPPVDSLKNLKGQKGCIFYVDPWNTSHIDPATGFMNLFRFPKNTVEFWREFFGCMDSVTYDRENDYFVFSFKYSKFKNFTRAKDLIDAWQVCSYEKRLYNKKFNNNWKTEMLDPTEKIKELLNDSQISFEDGYDLMEQILEKVNLKKLGWVFKQILNLRNSRINSDEDYILSPVKNSNGEFFDSRRVQESQPCDADANGAYHIALKGLQMTEENIVQENGSYKITFPKKPHEQWVSWVQDFHQR